VSDNILNLNTVDRCNRSTGTARGASAKSRLGRWYGYIGWRTRREAARPLVGNIFLMTSMLLKLLRLAQINAQMLTICVRNAGGCLWWYGTPIQISYLHQHCAGITETIPLPNLCIFLRIDTFKGNARMHRPSWQTYTRVCCTCTKHVRYAMIIASINVNESNIWNVPGASTSLRTLSWTPGLCGAPEIL